VMLVLAGLKGEEAIGELCRRYGVSQTTYYKLRDAFLQGGAEGIEHRGHTSEVAALKDRCGSWSARWGARRWKLRY